jgi:hypothetical protein
MTDTAAAWEDHEGPRSVRVYTRPRTPPRRNIQLCLMSDDLPAGPPLLHEALPKEAVAVALGRLGHLIALAVRRTALDPDQKGDEG